MSRPIDTQDFWNQRIEEATRHNTIRHSVYQTDQETWNDINRQHQELIQKHVKETDYVLDAGCGYGRACQFLPGRYVGVDFCDLFIKIAKEYHPDKTFFCHDLESLDVLFPSMRFDWVVCISIKGMIANNLGQKKWDSIQDQLIKVAKSGVMFLEYSKENEVIELGAN